MSDELNRTTTGGFFADMSVEVEQNSKGVNRRVRVNIQWENWSANSIETGGKEDEPDNPEDFMVGMGTGEGGSGKNQSARMVLSRLLLEGIAAADAAILVGIDSPSVIDADFTELVRTGALAPIVKGGAA